MKWLVTAVATFALLVAFAFTLIRFDHPLREVERMWAQPWDKVKDMSEALCRKITEGDDSSYVVCMSIERRSHKMLQTSFGLPEPEAVRLKRECAEFRYFTPQVRCVERRLQAETREN